MTRNDYMNTLRFTLSTLTKDGDKHVYPKLKKLNDHDIESMSCMPGRINKFVENACSDCTITLPEPIADCRPHALPLSNYEDGEEKLVAFIPAHYMGIDREQYEKMLPAIRQQHMETSLKQLM